jgi:NAD(P)-dependent dehydrogenase (short-subunit alcohol dehydrogenase family)
MTDKKVWLVTGAGRGMGVDMAKAALVQIVDQEEPPERWVAGADAVAAVEQKAHALLAQVAAYRELSTSLAVDAAVTGS